MRRGRTVSQPQGSNSCLRRCRIWFSGGAGSCLKGCQENWNAGMAKGGCCAVLHLREDNARFILLAIVMVIYMLTGATIFMFLERDREVEDRNSYYHALDTFRIMYPEVNETDLQVVLDHHAEAASAGIIEGKRQRWDFAGSFYFVGTVVSTIGNITLKYK